MNVFKLASRMALLGAVAIAIVACDEPSGPFPTATPAAVVAVTPAPTPEPTSTATSEPTSTVTPSPTPTPTPEPTSTVTPEPTLTVQTEISLVPFTEANSAEAYLQQLPEDERTCLIDLGMLEFQERAESDDNYRLTKEEQAGVSNCMSLSTEIRGILGDPSQSPHKLSAETSACLSQRLSKVDSVHLTAEHMNAAYAPRYRFARLLIDSCQSEEAFLDCIVDDVGYANFAELVKYRYGRRNPPQDVLDVVRSCRAQGRELLVELGVAGVRYWLYRFDQDHISKIVVQHGGQTVEYQRSESGWVNPGSPDIPVSAEDWAGKPLVLSNLPGELLFTGKGEDLESLGFGPTALTMELGPTPQEPWSGRVRVFLGNPSPSGETTYAMISRGLPGADRIALNLHDPVFGVPTSWARIVRELATDPPYPPRSAPTAVPAVPAPTATPEPPVTESERLVSRLSAAFAEDGDLNDFEKAYLRRISGASTPELALALSSSPLTEDATVTELEIDILKKIERYHPRLQAAIVSHAPQSAAPFLSGSVLSDQEAEALSALHSVFGIEAFYDAWQLDWLEINEIQAVLRLLQSYDPFSTVYGPTENTDSQDGLIERTFDQFSVGPAGSCVYCRGQKYFTSGSPTKDYRTSGYSPEEYLEYSKAVTQDVVVRTRLLHLVHAATVQFRELSPCDLRDYSKPELLIMAPNAMEFFDPRYDYYSYRGPIAYFINATTFMHSVEVNAQMLAAVAEPRWFNVDSDKGVLRLTVGDVLSPFTAATKIVAQGGPIEMSRTGCLEAAKRIVDWDRYRYTHFGGSDEQALSPFAAKVFPENPRFFPMWVMLLTNESGGQDKAQRLVGMMRSLNVPAGRLRGAVFPEVDHPDPDKGIHGGYFDDVLLPPWNVYFDRNIGFGLIDKFAPIENLLSKYDPGCRIKSDPSVAEHLRVSSAIFSCDSSVVHRPLDETFVDNLASEIDRLFKSAIEAATDNNVEAAMLKQLP